MKLYSMGKRVARPTHCFCHQVKLRMSMIIIVPIVKMDNPIISSDRFMIVPPYKLYELKRVFQSYICVILVNSVIINKIGLRI